MNLTDKVIVITGAASGMGEACAHLFAQEGAKVVLADRDQIRGRDVAAAVKASGGIAEFIATDVTDEKSIQAMVDRVVLCMKYEIAAMMRRGGGSIVNIASVGGLDGVPFMAPYSAVKHGVVGATRSAALETAAAGIRVNALCPGLIDTPMYRNLLAEGVDYSGVVRNIALGRAGTASEVADTALWLLSARSSYVTGQTIVVDGGLMIGSFGRPG